MSKFSVRQAIADADLEPYQFEDADGVDQTLPHMKVLSAAQLMRLLRDGQVSEVLAEVGVDPAVAEAMTDWPGHVLEPFIADWMEHSDVRMPGGEPGKSRTSTPSSTATPERSKRTSRGGGKTSPRSASAS